jgi:uncharacterized membrane protein YfbV (UPF0208 family)
MGDFQSQAIASIQAIAAISLAVVGAWILAKWSIKALSELLLQWRYDRSRRNDSFDDEHWRAGGFRD